MSNVNPNYTPQSTGQQSTNTPFPPKMQILEGVQLGMDRTAAPGSYVYSCVGAPSNAIGSNGDWCLRQDTQQIYQRIAGTWTATIPTPLPDPLTVAHGGTSVATFTAGFVKSPGGTGALTTIADPLTVGHGGTGVTAPAAGYVHSPGGGGAFTITPDASLPTGEKTLGLAYSTAVIDTTNTVSPGTDVFSVTVTPDGVHDVEIKVSFPAVEPDTNAYGVLVLQKNGAIIDISQCGSSANGPTGNVYALGMTYLDPVAANTSTVYKASVYTTSGTFHANFQSPNSQISLAAKQLTTINGN